MLLPPDGMTEAQQRTRTRLLTAGTDHFARFGYRRTNVADIAEEAGIGKGTVYLYFPSKIELLYACVAREKSALIPQLEAIVELPPAERLEAYLQIVIRFALTAPLSSALLKGDRELSAALADAATEGLNSDPGNGLAFLADLVVDAAPGVSEQDRDRLAKILATVISLPAHISPFQELVELSNEDFIVGYARVLARGVATHGHTAIHGQTRASRTEPT